MRVRFWGVRGSVPWATPLSIGHGCNTPCIELQAVTGERLVLDAGSGIVGLGEALNGVPRPIFRAPHSLPLGSPAGAAILHAALSAGRLSAGGLEVLVRVPVASVLKRSTTAG
jgi:hypothetical protein